MTYALITGTLFRQPEEKTAKSGKRYAVATIKSGFGENVEFWRVTAFSDAAVSALLDLAEGDALSAAGVLQVSVYGTRGQRAASNLALVADQIISRPRREEQRRP